MAQKNRHEPAPRKSRYDDDTKYVIKYRARPPLADAGMEYQTRVTGKATRKAMVKDLNAEGYTVTQQRRLWLGLF